MKCAACGFEDSIGNSYEYGTSFKSIGCIKNERGKEYELYMCPKCKTVRSE